MNALKITLNLLILFIVLFLAFCGNSLNKKAITINNSTIETIKFNPESAVEVTFDELFKSSEIIDLQQTDESRITSVPYISRTDSFLIIRGTTNYLVFDAKGNFRNKAGERGEGPNSISSHAFYYADNESILSICGTKWIKYGIDGSALKKGILPYTVYPFSFIPLNDSTWLFYVPYIYGTFDKLRLWTTNQEFKIQKSYLFSVTNLPGGGAGFMKFIYDTDNGIYITDRVVDTIYRFTEEKVEPVYVFDIGDYKYRKQIVMEKLGHNEATGLFTVVTSNAVLRGIKMNNRQYLLYYNRKTKTTKTISKIIDGTNLIEIGTIMGTDKNERIYWVLQFGIDPISDKAALKYRYTDLLIRKLELKDERNHFLFVTTLK